MEPTPIAVRHGDLFNHEKYSKLSDMTIVVEGKNMYAVRAIIEQRIPHLASAPPTLVAKSKVKQTHVLLELKDNSITFEAMLSILEYAYTGTINFEKVSLRQVMMILIAANKIGAENVGKLCERRVIQQLTLDTLFPILKLAQDSELLAIKATCMQYAMLNYNDVVGRKNGINIIGLDLFQEITMEKMKGEEVAEIAEPHIEEEDIIAEYNAVLRDQKHADAVAVFEAGEPVPFHRAVLAAHCDSLFRFVGNFSGDARKPAQITFEGVTREAFLSLLELVYLGHSPSISPVAACSLLSHLVEPYELWDVRTYCETIITDITEVNVLTILTVTYLPHNASRDHISKDLRYKCMSFLVENFPRVAILQLDYMSPEINLDILRAIHSHQKGSRPLESPHSLSEGDKKKKKKKKSESDDTPKKKSKRSEAEITPRKKKKEKKGDEDTPGKKKHTKRSKSDTNISKSSVSHE